MQAAAIAMHFMIAFGAGDEQKGVTRRRRANQLHSISPEAEACRLWGTGILRRNPFRFIVQDVGGFGFRFRVSGFGSLIRSLLVASLRRCGCVVVVGWVLGIRC